jgi:hypothetical protein
MIRCTRGRKCLGATLLPCWQGLRVCTLQIRFQHTHTCEPHINQSQYCYALRVHAHHFFYYHTRYAKAATATCSSTHRRLPVDQQGTFDAACKLVAAVLPRGHCCPTPAEVLRYMAIPQPEVVGACVNDCCVYCGNLKEVDECPTCDTVRLVEGKERKEFRFIPLERQLRHMFADPELAAKLRRDRIDWPQPQPGHVEVSLLCDQLATNQPCS